jgi:hypothetical protein
LEEDVSAEIKIASEDIKNLKDGSDQLAKEFVDYKRKIEQSLAQKDHRFEEEVRGCLREQL